MSLTDVEFTVLRFATDAIIGEPSKYARILKAAEREFPKSKPFQEAIHHLRIEMKTVGLSATPAATVKLGQIATKLLKARVAKKDLKRKDKTRQLAGSALMASLDLPKTRTGGNPQD